MANGNSTVATIKARVRSFDDGMCVVIDQPNKCFGIYNGKGSETEMRLYREGGVAVDGRTIDQVTDKFVLLRGTSEGDRGTILEYKDVVRLVPSAPVQAQTAETQPAPVAHKGGKSTSK